MPSPDPTPPMATMIETTAPIKAGRLTLRVQDVEISILTGIYSEETHLPQPLRVSVEAEMEARDWFRHDMPLHHSKNYLDLRWAIVESMPKDRHFTLIEAVADHIIETLFLQDVRVKRVSVTIVKLAISLNGESIGLTLERERP